MEAGTVRKYNARSIVFSLAKVKVVTELALGTLQYTVQSEAVLHTRIHIRCHILCTV